VLNPPRSDFAVPEKVMTKHADQDMVIPVWIYKHFVLIHSPMNDQKRWPAALRLFRKL
jgi:hypothetical protein